MQIRQVSRRALTVLRSLRRSDDPERSGEGVAALQILSMTRWLTVIDPPVNTSISVITATRDRPELLRRAARSVLSQSAEAWEWVVVNDGDRGACDALIKDLRDDRIRLVEANGVGLAAARNLGLDAATASTVCYLDDDNVMDPSWVQALSFALDQQPDAVWGYGARVVETPEAIVYRELGSMPYLEFPRFSAAKLRSGNFIDANTIFHRRGACRFDERTKSQSDWELVLQLAADSPPLRVPAVSCMYRTTHGPRMSRAEDRFADRGYIRSKHLLD